MSNPLHQGERPPLQEQIPGRLLLLASPPGLKDENKRHKAMSQTERNTRGLEEGSGVWPHALRACGPRTVVGPNHSFQMHRGEVTTSQGSEPACTRLTLYTPAKAPSPTPRPVIQTASGSLCCKTANLVMTFIIQSRLRN